MKKLPFFISTAVFLIASVGSPARAIHIIDVQAVELRASFTGTAFAQEGTDSDSRAFAEQGFTRMDEAGSVRVIQSDGHQGSASYSFTSRWEEPSGGSYNAFGDNRIGADGTGPCCSGEADFSLSWILSFQTDQPFDVLGRFNWNKGGFGTFALRMSSTLTDLSTNETYRGPGFSGHLPGPNGGDWEELGLAAGSYRLEIELSGEASGGNGNTGGADAKTSFSLMIVPEPTTDLLVWSGLVLSAAPRWARSRRSRLN